MDLQGIKISVLIPYKNQNDEQRAFIWTKIKERYETLMPELEICIGIDDNDLYNRSRAINNAAKKATGDVFIITDADVIFSTETIKNLLPIVYDYPWIVPFSNGHKLTQRATARLLSEGLTDTIEVSNTDIETSFNVPATFMSVITKENFFKIRGMDERFEGWGGEDDALRDTLECLCGKHYRTSGNVYHLWHPSAPFIKKYHDKNLQLLRRYESAKNNKRAMINLINEKKLLSESCTIQSTEIKQDWWNKNLKDEKMMETFKGWIGSYEAKSKKFTRNYIEKMAYKSLLDCGCGCCTEYYGYLNDGYSLNYTGADTCNLLINEAIENGIDARLASIEDLPIADNSYDVVYIRHILEHLPQYNKALKEAIRVARKEVIVVFFLKPKGGNARTIISYNEKENLYNNEYNQHEIETYLNNNEKVKELKWEYIGTEAVLHIYVEKQKMIIPKLFHRIWMGNIPMPDEFVKFGETWEKLHPGWEMKLWNENNIFKLKNQNLYDNAVHPVQKVEIARLEILYQFGGVYLDCDFECLKNIEPLISGMDAFSASEDPGIFSMGIMGAIPKHEVFKAMIDGLDESIKTYHNYPLNYQAGPLYATRIIKNYPNFKLFDAELFYPYSYREKHRKGEFFPNAYAVHHWANSANL